MLFQNIQRRLINETNLDESQTTLIALAVANTDISGAQKLEVLTNLLKLYTKGE